VDGKQPVQFTLQVTGKAGTIVNPTFVVDGKEKLEIPTGLNPGESLVFDGTSPARQYDSLGHQSITVDVKSKIPLISKGHHTVRFSAECREAQSAVMVVVFRSMGKGELVRKGK
jgi:hypothetical protein